MVAKPLSNDVEASTSWTSLCYQVAVAAAAPLPKTKLPQIGRVVHLGSVVAGICFLMVQAQFCDGQWLTNSQLMANECSMMLSDDGCHGMIESLDLYLEEQW